MIPSRPIRGFDRTSRASSMTSVSTLAIDVLVAVVEGIDALGLEGLDVAQRAGEVDGARGVLAHHRGLHRVAGVAADREHAVAAHQHGLRAMLGKRLDD